MALLAFARALFVTNLKSALALRLTFLLQVTFMVLNNLTFFVFWWVLFDRVPNLRGWQLPEVQLLFGLSASAFGLGVAVFGGVRHLGRFIDEGALDSLLAQPKPTLLYALGMRSQASGFGDFLSGLGFLGMSGYLTWSNALWIVPLVLAGSLTFVAAGVVFFSLAFWLGRSESLSRQLWELLITFSLYPEPLFGGALRLLLFTLLPAGFVSYLPVRIVRDASALDALYLFVGTAAYALFAFWFFGRGLRRYSSGSRFGVFG
jgi:ABC-2 type transport system permease protein